MPALVHGPCLRRLRGRRRPISAFYRSFEVNVRAYYRTRAAADTRTFGEKVAYPSYPLPEDQVFTADLGFKRGEQIPDLTLRSMRGENTSLLATQALYRT